MSAYAIYRLPHEDHATLIQQTEGEPVECFSCTELNGKSGFVIAPFEVKENQPILLIQGESKRVACGSGDVCVREPSLDPISPDPTYAIDFANYHSQLELGMFRKIVLARCADEKKEEKVEPMDLFYRACALYPRMFIALVETEKSGCWLTATPEILLDGEGQDWRTIALAGTMKLEGEQLNGEGETLRWSTKNIQEQRIVATYITECLEQFTGDFREEGPRTVRAANLVHLRSDFTSSSRVRTMLATCCRPSIPHLPSVDYPSVRPSSLSSGTNIPHVGIIVGLWDPWDSRLTSMSRCDA